MTVPYSPHFSTFHTSLLYTFLFLLSSMGWFLL